MSAPIPQPATHECPFCHKAKPKTEQYFELRRYVNTAGVHSESWRSQCRLCRRARLKSGLAPRYRLPGEHNRHDEPAYVPGPKPCVACHDMPWRVLGPRCPCCKLVYALEPRPELQAGAAAAKHQQAPLSRAHARRYT